MAAPHDLGRRAERLAAAHLTGKGWRIVARNWRFHHKELDIVAERDEVVAFVEVKARTAGGLATAREAITSSKRRELARAARAWVATRGRPGQSYRFDAVVVAASRGRLTLEHIEDAWRLEPG